MLSRWSRSADTLSRGDCPGKYRFFKIWFPNQVEVLLLTGANNVDRRTWRAKNHDIDVKEQIRDGIYRVNGHRGIDYITNVDNYSCTCPDWQKEKPRGGCKHIRAVNIAIVNGDAPSHIDRTQGPSQNKDNLYPDDWYLRSRKVKERDNWTCQDCGESNIQLHVHHIVPAGKDGSHELSNLITLCQGCHEQVHGTQFLREPSAPSRQTGNTVSTRSYSAGRNSSGDNGNPRTVGDHQPGWTEDVEGYSLDGKTATERTRNKTGPPERLGIYSKGGNVPSWSGGYQRYPKYQQTATEKSRGNSEDETVADSSNEFSRGEEADPIPIAREISIEAPSILPYEKPKLRTSLRGRQVYSGADELTDLGNIEVITTIPSTTKPASPKYVEVTDSTRIRIR